MKHYYEFGVYYNAEELQEEEGYIIKEFVPGEIKSFDLIKVTNRANNIICTCEWYHVEDVNSIPHFELTCVTLQNVNDGSLREIPINYRIIATSLEKMDTVLEKLLNNVDVLANAFEMDQYNPQDMAKLKNMIEDILKK
ncbi:MAG: hypothetical protein QXI58_06145 [Candidatus Micrarchaeia archaeon]